MEGRIWCLRAVQGLRERMAWPGPLVLPVVTVVGVWSSCTKGDRHRSEGHAWVCLRQHPASSLTSESIDPPWQKPWESPQAPASEHDEGLRDGPPSSSRPAPGFHSPHQDTEEAGRQRKRRGNQSRQDKS